MSSLGFAGAGAQWLAPMGTSNSFSRPHLDLLNVLNSMIYKQSWEGYEGKGTQIETYDMLAADSV